MFLRVLSEGGHIFVHAVRRIAAIVLPELACELACHLRSRDSDGLPFAVIVDDDEHISGGEVEVIDKTATLHAVDRRAWQLGARPGQSASQASAYVGQLNILRIAKSRVLDALGALAEALLEFGTCAALTLRVEKGQLPLRDEAKAASLRYPLGAGAGPHDTVWLDVTGCAGLVGGEDVLAAELAHRARDLGHRARVAIADGPRIAQSLARWAPKGQLIAEPYRNDAALAGLSIASLPLPPALITWLGKLGILSIADLAKLDRARLSHRLGAAARDLMEVIAGRDLMPLHQHQPARRIVESTSFEHEIKNTEPLLFVLRGLTSRAITRLSSRGESCGRASMRLDFDRSVIDLKSRGLQKRLSDHLDLSLDLPVPLSRQSELMRALAAKLERTTLKAPVVSLTLILEDFTEKSRHQLEIGGRPGIDPSALPTLIAELNAHLGSDRVGVLEVVDHHRPEARSKLVPVDPKLLVPTRPISPASPISELDDNLPTRLLSDPIPIPDPSVGALVMIDKRAFIIERLRHTGRLDQIDWWSNDPLNRDYARAWLNTSDQGDEACEAWLYIDRNTGHAFVHGWFE